MLIILSQKIDSVPSYSDKLFNVYHFPSRYYNQIHEDDVFIYYQGNQHDKSQRYYFGIGRVTRIKVYDANSFSAILEDCRRFNDIVPIYLPNGGYIEGLGYETVRRKATPPWQSSVRPLSQEAYDYILNAAGISYVPHSKQSIEALNEDLKIAIRRYYIKKEKSAILQIRDIANSLIQAGKMTDTPLPCKTQRTSTSVKPLSDSLSSFENYCSTMRMSYSYKPLLILSLLERGDRDGRIKLIEAVRYFREFYDNRRHHGNLVEKKPCIYLNPAISDKEIISNLISNPIHALTLSGYFVFDTQTCTLCILPHIWKSMNRYDLEHIKTLCVKRLEDYYQENTQ